MVSEKTVLGNYSFMHIYRLLLSLFFQKKLVTIESTEDTMTVKKYIKAGYLLKIISNFST